MPCTHLRELLKEERSVIERHLKEFMAHKNIEDCTQAKEGFIKEYGWIMREMYCDLCPDKESCDTYKEAKKNNSIPE